MGEGDEKDGLRDVEDENAAREQIVTDLTKDSRDSESDANYEGFSEDESYVIVD